MLKGMDKLLTGDLLKILCDMGHGDELVIADANFPGETCAQRLIRLPGIDAVRVAQAVLSVFPLDTYTDPALIMDLTQSDKDKNMSVPEIWAEFERETGGVKKMERFAFYERAKKAYCVIQTGEERLYGNLILVKGVVL